MIRKNSDYPLQPPRERGTGRAFAFALVMHALLGFFLYHGIQWQNSTPEGAEAELWTEVPDTAIARPVPPPPPVPVAPAPPVPDEQADIALQEKKRQQQEAARQAQLAEQLRQQKLQAQQEAEAKRQQQLAADQAAQLAAQKAAAAKQKQQQQQQADRLKQQQLAEQQKQQQLKEQQQQEQQKQADAEAAQKKAEAQKAVKAKAQADAAAQAKKVDSERRARLAQMMQGSAGGTGSTDGLGKSGTGTGSGGTATSPGYSDKVRRAVRPHISWGGETAGLETVVSVRCSPTGTLLDATIQRSSGNSAWDDAALRAVQRTDPMPQDINGKTPTSFLITLKPAG